MYLVSRCKRNKIGETEREREREREREKDHKNITKDRRKREGL